MKNRFNLLLTIGIAIIMAISCQKDEDSANPTQNTTVSDKDGNVYKTVTIGTQVWMAENLKSTKFNDGTAIPLITVTAEWESLSTPGYCWYDNNENANKSTYGALYNWFTVNTNKLCPSGWHVPSDSEFATLVTFLGGETLVSGKLRESGTSHWASPNSGATNESGFTALPGGIRELGNIDNLPFRFIGLQSIWWSSTENSATTAGNLSLHNDSYFRVKAIRKVDGFSIRCLKN